MTSAISSPIPVRARSTEAAAQLDLAAAAPAGLAREFGIAGREIAGAACLSVAALPGSRVLNRVIDLDGSAADADLAAIAAHYRAAGAGHVVAVSGAAAARGLDRRLVERGYVADRSWDVFAAAPAPVWPADGELRVARTTGAHRERFGAIIAAGFELPDEFGPWLAALVGRPGWSCLVVLDDGEPIAAGAVFVAGTTAWMGFGATLADHRGRGAQALLIAARRAEAGRRGCARVITETGSWTDSGPNVSYRNILRGGFRVVATRPNLRAPAWAPDRGSIT